jgi:tRNA A-37 threonylcarbamoyl transferase component Bud32
MARREAFVTARAHGVTWRCVPEFADFLPLLDLEPVRAPERLDPAKLVKNSTVRTVARLADPSDPAGSGLYVKRFKFRDRSHRLRSAVTGGKPLHEWRIGRALRAAGIRTCLVLACGLRRRRGLPREGFLVSRAVPDAVPLATLVQAHAEGRERLTDGWRRELVGEAAAVTADLAKGGFYHYDFHWGNILVRQEAPAGERLYVVDLHAIRRGRVGRRRLLRMIGKLAGSLRQSGLTTLEKVGFLRAFLARRQGAHVRARGSVRRWARAVEAKVRRLGRAHARSRTRRCLVESSLFTRERVGGFVIHRRRDFPVAAALEAVEAHRRAVSGSQGSDEVRRKGLRTEVTVCRSGSVPARTLNQPAPRQVHPGLVCVKAFLPGSLGGRVKDGLRPRGRARAAWVAHRGCHVRGVPAAHPIALLESRPRLAGQGDYLVTEALPHDGTLLEAVVEWDLCADEKRALGRAVAELLRRMAEAGVYHPDTKPTNIVVERGEGGFRLHLVDLDRTRFGVRLRRVHWEKCLMRIDAQMPWHVSVLDRMRCLRRCGEGRWSARERLEVARRVRQMS